MAGGCKFGGGEMRGKPHTSTTAELQAAGECRPLPGSEDSGFNFPEIPNPCALKGGFSPFSSPVRTHFPCSFHSGANRAGDLGSRPTAPPSVGTLEHGVAGPPLAVEPWVVLHFWHSCPGADGRVPPPAIPALSWAVSGPPLASHSPAEGCDGAQLVQGFPKAVPAP